jgi:hypothetical protein
VAVRTQDISVRSMLMRVRSQAKCVGASALTSNLPVSLLFSPAIELKSYFFSELGGLCAFARDNPDPLLRT